jgi:hypothetical protein
MSPAGAEISPKQSDRVFGNADLHDGRAGKILKTGRFVDRALISGIAGRGAF